MYFLYDRKIMKIIRKNVTKDKESFYVVTRDNRRVEPINYKVKWEAEERADKLIKMVNDFDPSSKVSIIYTSSPERIR